MSGSVVLEQGISSVIQPGSEQKQICHCFHLSSFFISINSAPSQYLTNHTSSTNKEQTRPKPTARQNISRLAKSVIALICEHEREGLIASAVPSVHHVSGVDATSCPKAPAVTKESGTSGTVGNINCESIHEGKMLPTRREY